MGHCSGNQLIFGKVSNADWYYLHSLH